MRLAVVLGMSLAGCSFPGTGTPGAIDADPAPTPDAPPGTAADAAPGTPDAAPDAPPPDAPACPPGYAPRVAGSCHRFVMTPRTWQNAEADCELANAHLVVVDDATEDGDVPDNVWIGYTELVTAGTFRWATGATPGFEAWAQGQPSAGGAACTEARSDGWHDDNCPEAKWYVCEYDGVAADPTQF
jgi:hypothetical protein